MRPKEECLRPGASASGDCFRDDHCRDNYIDNYRGDNHDYDYYIDYQVNHYICCAFDNHCSRHYDTEDDINGGAKHLPIPVPEVLRTVLQLRQVYT